MSLASSHKLGAYKLDQLTPAMAKLVKKDLQSVIRETNTFLKALEKHVKLHKKIIEDGLLYRISHSKTSQAQNHLKHEPAKVIRTFQKCFGEDHHPNINSHELIVKCIGIAQSAITFGGKFEFIDKFLGDIVLKHSNEKYAESFSKLTGSDCQTPGQKLHDLKQKYIDIVKKI